MQVEPIVAKLVRANVVPTIKPEATVQAAIASEAKETGFVQPEAETEEEGPMVLFLGEDVESREEPDLTGDQLTQPS
jgi:hypothetical protein